MAIREVRRGNGLGGVSTRPATRTERVAVMGQTAPQAPARPVPEPASRRERVRTSVSVNGLGDAVIMVESV